MHLLTKTLGALLLQYFTDQLADLLPGLLQYAKPVLCDGVVLADLATHHAVSPAQVPSLLQAMQHRVECSCRKLVSVPRQLLEERQAIHRLVRCMVQDVNSDEAQEEVSEYISPTDIGYRDCTTPSTIAQLELMGKGISPAFLAPVNTRATIRPSNGPREPASVPAWAVLYSQREPQPTPVPC